MVCGGGKAEGACLHSLDGDKPPPSLPTPLHPTALSTPTGVPLRAADFGSSFPSSLLRLAASLRRRVSAATAAAVGGGSSAPLAAPARVPPAPLPLRRLSRASGDGVGASGDGGGWAVALARSPLAPTQPSATLNTHKRPAATRTPAPQPRAKRRRVVGAAAASPLAAHSPPLTLAARVAAAGALFADAIKGMHGGLAEGPDQAVVEAEAPGAGVPAAAPPVAAAPAATPLPSAPLPLPSAPPPPPSAPPPLPSAPPPPPRRQTTTRPHPTIATSARADARTAAGVALSGVGARRG